MLHFYVSKEMYATLRIVFHYFIVSLVLYSMYLMYFLGDGTMATIRNLLPDKTYYFKLSARNNKGYGPPGPIVTFKTPSNTVVTSDYNLARASNNDDDNENISPIVLYAVFGIGAGIILVLVIGSLVLIRMKCQAAQPNDPRTNKTYHNTEAINATTRDKLNHPPPPPDLWIGHDQLELKDISDENGSAICDETGETTLTRSTPDYRATMERTRNYVQNGQFSGENFFPHQFA